LLMLKVTDVEAAVYLADAAAVAITVQEPF
jgi:hypothetical protein